jgi:hypothetical protein
MQSFTPVMLGSRYGRTSLVSFFGVQPKGLMTWTKEGCGIVGGKSGKYEDCNSITPVEMQSFNCASATI